VSQIPKLNSTKDTYSTIPKQKDISEKNDKTNNIQNLLSNINKPATENNKKPLKQNIFQKILSKKKKENISTNNNTNNTNSNSNINTNKNTEINTTNNNNNIISEKPIMTTKNDILYLGKIANGKRNGHGKLILPDESQYEGNFKNNEFDGYGVYKCKSYIYSGDFVEGKKSGKGKYEDLLKNTIYEGEFSDDKKNGFGTEKYDDGSIYKGEFKNGVKEGKGNLILHSYKNKGNDLVYNGEFKNNLICGIGSMKINSKKDYYGEWSNNEMNGYGMARDGNLRHYGYFSHGIKEGYGASFYEDQGYVFVGKWEEDLVTGPSILMILDIEEKNADKMIEKENIVGMYKGEIIDMKLGDKDINMFKNSEEYQEMTNLFRNKFYPDFLKYIEEKNNNKNEI
jgi:hypothetical protein